MKLAATLLSSAPAVGDANPDLIGADWVSVKNSREVCLVELGSDLIRDPLLKRRPYKLWARIELRIGEPIPPGEATSERLEEEVRRLRADDR